MQFTAFSKDPRVRWFLRSRNWLIMKLMTLFIFALMFRAEARLSAQTISLSLRDAPLEKLFEKIEEQSGYQFWYNENLLSGTGNITLTVKDATLKQVLDHCLKGKALTYSILEKIVIIRKSRTDSSAMLVIPDNLSGSVLDEDGKPIVGATVRIRPSGITTATDINGRFQFPNVAFPVIVEITSIGYESMELKVSTDKPLTAVLKKKISELDKVVIIPYGTTTKRLNTGSVSTVTSEEIEKPPVSNPLEALEGRMAGVYIQQTTGTSGGGFNIQIRGQNSLRTSQNSPVDGNLPLYIVDGVPFSNSSLSNPNLSNSSIPLASPLNTINPADIERIEILKDGDATAIYGSRGANGVVLITTKKGKAGQTRGEITVYSGKGRVTRQMDLLNTEQYLKMRHEAKANDNEPLYPYDVDINGTWDSTHYTDWQKTLLGGTANTLNVQAAVSGGNQYTQFLFGGGYYKQGTVLPGNFSDQKGSGHLNITHISENRKFGATITSSYLVDINNIAGQDPTGASLSLSPDAPSVYNLDGTLNWANSMWDNPFSYLFLFCQILKYIDFLTKCLSGGCFVRI